MASSNLIGPGYYKRGKIQVWDFIRDQDLGFHLGNAIKYICRAGHKDSKVADLKKAIHYLQNELDNTIEAQPASSGVSQSIQRIELAKSPIAQYTADFDR